MASNFIDLIIDRDNNNYDIHDTRIPTLPNDETKFLNGKGEWTVPDGSGGGGPELPGDASKYYNGAGGWTVPTDTKNTAGGDNSTANIYLIGVNAQTTDNGYAVTHSNNHLYYRNNRLYIFDSGNDGVDEPTSNVGRYLSLRGDTCRVQAGSTIQLNGEDYSVIQYINFEPDSRSISIRADVDAGFSPASAIQINSAHQNETSISKLRLYGTTGGWRYVSVGDNEPSNPSEGDIWIDTNEE